MKYVYVVLMTLIFAVLIRPMVHALQRGNYRCMALVNGVSKGYYSVLLTMQVVMYGAVLLPTPWDSTFLSIIALALTIVANRTKSKLPLRYTSRVLRLMAVFAVLVVFILWLVPCFILPIFLPLVVMLALGIVYPIEWGVQRYYYCKAKSRLATTNATKIAITGSFGKTSVKHILAHMLPNSIASPASYNTPMGIAKFVNGERLDQYDYVLLEMGARRRGDIAQLCAMCAPTVGIVVGIAPQHIETLGDIRGVIAVKQELSISLPHDGVVILNGYDDIVSTWTDVGCCHKVVSCDILQHTVVSSNVHGTNIVVHYMGNDYDVNVPLLGVAHIHNVLLCMACALALGQDIEYLLQRIASLPSIPHRMQYIAGNVHIIDDSYNANIEGIAMCCESVANLSGVDRRIVIAQGIVECGNMCAQLNTKVGELLGEVFDVVVLTGVNSINIATGIADRCIVHIEQDINSAVARASEYYTSDCVVVFSNDIP